MANKVDQHEGAHYELPHLDLCCLQIQLFWLLDFQTEVERFANSVDPDKKVQYKQSSR